MGTVSSRSNPDSAPATPTDPTSTRAATRCGCRRASSRATPPPSEWPTTVTGPSTPAAPRTSSRASAFAASPIAGRGSEPQPGRSGASTLWSVVSSAATASQSIPAPGWPCTRTTTAPVPLSIGTVEAAGAFLTPLLTLGTMPRGGTHRPATAQPGEGSLDAPPGDEPQGLDDGVGRHLRGAELPVHKTDRYLPDSSPRSDRAIGHLDLEAVAVRANRVQVDASEQRRAVGAEPRGRVFDVQSEHHIGVEVAPLREQPARQAPVRYGSAGDVP